MWCSYGSRTSLRLAAGHSGTITRLTSFRYTARDRKHPKSLVDVQSLSVHGLIDPLRHFSEPHHLRTHIYWWKLPVEM